MKRWYVVYTKTGQEQVAEGNLLRQGYEVYLPRYRRRIRHARRTQTVRTPLFPRYLFVRLDLETDPWLAIDSTIGAVGLVRFTDKPAWVRDSVVTEVLNRQDDGGLVRLVDAADLCSGDKVAVSDGALSEVTGVFLNSRDSDRVQVLFRLMGRDVTATVRSADLRRAS